MSTTSSIPGHRKAVLETPFHPRTAALCLTHDWLRWAGYATVNVYDNVELEYFAIRNQATLYDLSPMSKYEVGGPDAERYLNRLMTRDVRKLKPGRVAYCVWCDDDGRVIDDGTLFRLAADRFRICCQEHQYGWLTDSAIGFEVTITDGSAATAGLALQGPTSCALLKRAGFAGAERLRPFDLAGFTVEGLAVMVSRTGFTGDLGYELWVDSGDALALWDLLWRAGDGHGLRPIGSAALDLARIEAGFIMTNVDFVSSAQALRHNRGRTPFELGLDRLVDLDKGHFTGRRALLAAREAGPRFRLVGLEVAGNKPARGALIYRGGKHEAGQVTSALWSPTCKRNLALATLRAGKASGLQVEIYLQKELKWERVMARCQVVGRPFFSPERRRATPPSDF